MKIKVYFDDNTDKETAIVNRKRQFTTPETFNLSVYSDDYNE